MRSELALRQNRKFPKWITVDTNLPKLVNGTNFHLLSPKDSCELLPKVVAKIADYLQLPYLQDVSRWRIKSVELSENLAVSNAGASLALLARHHLSTEGASISYGHGSHTVRNGPKLRRTRIYCKDHEHLWRYKTLPRNEALIGTVRHEVILDRKEVEKLFGSASLERLIEILNSETPRQILQKSWMTYGQMINDHPKLDQYLRIIDNYPGLKAMHLVAYLSIAHELGFGAADKLFSLSSDARRRYRLEIRSIIGFIET